MKKTFFIAGIFSSISLAQVTNSIPPLSEKKESADSDKKVTLPKDYRAMTSFYLNRIENQLLGADSRCGNQLKSKSILEFYYSFGYPYHLDKIKCSTISDDPSCKEGCQDPKLQKYLSCVFNNSENAIQIKSLLESRQFNFELMEEFKVDSQDADHVRKTFLEIATDFGKK